MTEKKLVEQHQIDRINLINTKAGIETAQSQAGTEAESSKDYTGRVVFEFFQNAIDRAISNIWLELTNECFIISNDGQSFSIFAGKDPKGKKSDFHSLNTIHNGAKIPGESVGNKGVGFKSCWNVCKNVSIESLNQDKKAWGFELFNPIKESDFENDDIKEAIRSTGNKVPSFYFPKYYDSKKENFNKGAVTKITIKFDKEDQQKAYNEIKKELDEFQKSEFFFLKQLKNRGSQEFNIHILINHDCNDEPKNSQKGNWKIISLKDEEYKPLFEELKQAKEYEKYENIPKEPNIAIAFPPDEIEEFDTNFYTYLPTQEQCGFNVLIHADFALDNARKHILENDYNNKVLEIAAKLFVNELLTKTKLHNYKSFAKFLMPNNKNDIFAKLVWEELVGNNNLIEILKKVYKKDVDFPKESYELLFQAMSSFIIPRKSGEWKKDYYQKIYNETTKYFINNEIYIVWIDEDNKTFLPPKKENEKYEYSLFYQQEENSFLEYSLLSNITNLKISNFESLKDNTILFENNIIRRFSTEAILRVLKNEESINIIKFIQQLLHNTKEELSSEVKNQLLELKLPTKNGFQKVSQCYMNIDVKITNLFNENFYEVDKTQLEKIDNPDKFLEKIGVANNRLPFSIKLPFKANCTFPKSNILKDFIKESIDFLNENIIQKLKAIQWWWDERNNNLVAPKDVFLFKEHDNRKIDSIAQEKKTKDYEKLYFCFNIEEIEDTYNVNKFIEQLNNMKSLNIDGFHQDIYKKITFQLSKIYDNENIDIPVLITDINTNDIKYVEEKEKVIFLETKYKMYKEELKSSYDYLGYFDTNISHKFLQDIVDIQIFNPNYNIEYKDENNQDTEPDFDNALKLNLQEKFLATFFAIANEVLGSHFEKNDAIKRWEYLSINRAFNVILVIKDEKSNQKITVGTTEKNDVDVLYIPLKDRHNKPTQIGKVAHDLVNPFENSNLRKFAQVFAEGIFRNQKLKSDFELYITAFLNDDDNLKKDILVNKGVEEIQISQMKHFIKENLLEKEEKNKIISILNRLGLQIDIYDQIREFERYDNLEINFNKFKKEFEEVHRNIISNIIDEYRLYIKHQIIKNIENNKKYLQVLCFMQKHKNRDYFTNKFNEIKNENIDSFKNESDIFKRFKVTKINEKLDSFIEAEIDLEYETDEIDEEKITLDVLQNEIKANSNPNVGSAKQSKSEQDKQNKKQLINQNRGLGQELKIAYKYSKKLFDNPKLKSEFITELKKYDYEISKDKIKNYTDNLENDYSKLDFAKKVINIASNKLDGLGYDLIIPEIKNNKLLNILKVELKSTVINEGKIQVHFSKNEISRIKYFTEKEDIENKTFCVWLNSEANDITAKVSAAVASLPKVSPFYFEDYILTLGILK